MRRNAMGMGRVCWGLLAAVTCWVGCGPTGAEPTQGGTPVATVAQAVAGGTARWVRRSVGAESAYVKDSAVDRDGSSILVGAYWGSEKFGGVSLPPASGLSSAFLVKYSQGGQLLWARGDSTMADFDSVVVDRERNITLVGTAFSDGIDFGGGPLPEGPFLAQFSSSGHFRWARHLPGTFFGYPPTLAVDREDNIVLAASVDGLTDFGGGPRTTPFETAAIAKYTPDGDYLWDRVFASQDDSNIEAVTTDSDNNIYVSGFFTRSADFGGGVLVAPDYEAPVVAKFSPGGSHRWSQSLENLEDSARFHGIAVHGNRVVVTGRFDSAFTFGGDTFSAGGAPEAGMVLAYTRDGETRWGHALGVSMSDVAADQEDDMTVLGYASAGDDVGTGPLPPNSSGYVFVSKFDRVHGTRRWVRTFDSTSLADLSLSVSRHGEAAFAGSFSGPMDFGTGTLQPSVPGKFDVFLLRMSP